MELPNIHFQDFPIEFKKINPIDFKYKDSLGIKTNGFEVPEKIIIEPNEKGYIYESLNPHLHLEEKNTVVINAPVGYGKSYAIIKTIKRIYDEFPNSLIIVATPFVSLVEQYVNDIEKDGEIPSTDIYDYTDLGRNFEITYHDKRVQVVTVNTLLGNPGEDGFKNSEIKRRYLNTLINTAKKNNSKVFFIYDEIHDAIQNFKEEFIFNLWKWKDVIHKNFIISATYNEASKVVIEYLAELTDRKISIIEAIRKPFPNKQSKLYLHYSSSHYFKTTTDEIVNVISDSLNRNKKIDILCYSKTLAQSIINDKTGIGKKLKEKFGELNDCTSELVSNQRTENKAPKNRYNKNKCNIGTNFKSGVSIEKENHSFIIIMPPRSTRLWFRNRYGIFSGGINSVIQALARQRKKGEIHIILPRPDRFDIDSLQFVGLSEPQKQHFKEWYTKVEYFDKNIESVRYFPLNIQDLLLKDFYYDKLEPNVENEIKHISKLDRTGLTELRYPPYEIFKLNRGEEYLANNYKFLGEDIAAYITYGAFTNQFINCKLAGIEYQTTLFFEEGKIQEKLNHYFNKYFGEDYYNSRTTYSNFNMFYMGIRNELFANHDMKYHKIPVTKKQKEKAQWNKINPYNNKDFEIQLLRFCAILYFYRNYYYQEDFEARNTDIEYTRSNYFLDCIAVARTINLDQINYLDRYKNKIKAYQNLDYFRTKLIDSISITTRGEIFNYLPVKPLSDFINTDETSMALETIDLLIEYDELIKNDIFNFRRNFEGKTTEQKIESFYKILVESFVNIIELEEYKKITVNGRRKNINLVNSIKLLPQNTNRIIDFINPADYDSNYMNYVESNKFIIDSYGSYEAYQEQLNSLLALIKQKNED